MAKKDYTLEERERGLLELVLAGGSARAAHERLKQRGYAIPVTTLQTWRRTDAERYSEIAETEARRVGQLIAAEAEEVIRRASVVEHKILDRIDASVDDIPIRDLAGALRNVTTTKGINVERIASPQRGRATSVVHHRGADDIREELINRLKKLGLVVDGTAEEIVDESDLPSLPPGDA